MDVVKNGKKGMCRKGDDGEERTFVMMIFFILS